MSNESDEGDAETIPVDARCVGCQDVSVKQAPEHLSNARPGTTFTTTCWKCGGEEYHNLIAVLTGAMGDRP